MRNYGIFLVLRRKTGITQLIDRVQGYELVMPELIDCLPAEPMVGIKLVFAYALFLHCIPQIIISYHFLMYKFYLLLLFYLLLPFYYKGIIIP